jgi:hypothetical protein
MVPPPWANAEWERVLNLSVADAGGVKRVASQEGLAEIKTWTHRAPESEGNTSPEQTCAITQMAFEEGDEVAQMPCGHVFDNDSLTRWLERESAACPVCRKEVASREVARSPEDRASSSENSEGEAVLAGSGIPAGLDDAITAGLLQPLVHRGGARLQMHPVGMPLAQRRLGNMALARVAEIEQEGEDDQIEAAIIAAVMRDSMTET